jgi:branched-chain amino acid transport system substrate-binding protein
VIEALPGVQFDAPGGLVTVDGQTNHAIMDIHLVRSNRNKGFDHIETFKQRSPADTQAVCDLTKNPDDNQQYTLQL